MPIEIKVISPIGLEPLRSNCGIIAGVEIRNVPNQQATKGGLLMGNSWLIQVVIYLMVD